MNKAQFDELLASVQEMDEIVAGKKKPARGSNTRSPESSASAKIPGSRKTSSRC